VARRERNPGKGSKTFCSPYFFCYNKFVPDSYMG
jgi:hypothetical protein